VAEVRFPADVVTDPPIWIVVDAGARISSVCEAST